jgi:hypothetical protein
MRGHEKTRKADHFMAQSKRKTRLTHKQVDRPKAKEKGGDKAMPGYKTLHVPLPL